MECTQIVLERSFESSDKRHEKWLIGLLSSVFRNAPAENMAKPPVNHLTLEPSSPKLSAADLGIQS